MSNSATDSPPAPSTMWAARGRRTDTDTDTDTDTEDVLRRQLGRLKESGVLDDFTEPPVPDGTAERVFEARWRVAGDVTVRARLTLVPPRDDEDGPGWRLVAEAERPWDERWPSPATLFWPEDDTAWDRHHAVADLRLRGVNALPADERAMRRVLRSAARDSWAVNLVVHEAMTPDEAGRLPLARLLPPGLRHRVVEHRAAPQQLRAVNWALRDLGVEVPRGGAVLLPPDPAPKGYDTGAYAVRSVFLDGSEPAELVDVLRRFTALPGPLPRDAEAALTDLRENWTLMTLEEELARARGLVTMYAEALEAMTRSRDLYREAAERAQEALAAYQDLPAAPATGPAARPASPLQQLTRSFGRLRGAGRPDGSGGDGAVGGVNEPS
ncbi:hypothetical protein AB0F77_18775 [Streptomyces sp. NPDC026672]|uniref:hypothetical protein n=1 Tax=unclassified Streptomyces TaxID=2593676 RepID=UPI0033ED760E